MHIPSSFNKLGSFFFCTAETVNPTTDLASGFQLVASVAFGFRVLGLSLNSLECEEVDWVGVAYLVFPSCLTSIIYHILSSFIQSDIQVKINNVLPKNS